MTRSLLLMRIFGFDESGLGLAIMFCVFIKQKLRCCSLPIAIDTIVTTITLPTVGTTARACVKLHVTRLLTILPDQQQLIQERQKQIVGMAVWWITQTLRCQPALKCKNPKACIKIF